MSNGGRWGDLGPRVGSAVVMVAAGFGAIWAGGVVFGLFVALICGAMVWELSRMLDPQAAAIGVQMGIMTGAMILFTAWLPPFYVVPFLLAPAVAGAARIASGKGLYVIYAGVIALAGYALISVRVNLGFTWIFWLICVVIASDVAGYFAGKSIGGAKLWPRVSPNKTWSGTVAGWVGAGVVGMIFAPLVGAGAGLAVVSVATAMVAQAGDIGESALKRHAGVKDSSALIPGHGGVMDRFDGMLGAALFVPLSSLLFGFPAGVL
jgi:phosphatidate cytidylyltransferase